MGRGDSESGNGNRTPRYTAQETEPRLPVPRLFLLGPFFTD